MKIKKELKNVAFEYDEEKKVFTLYDHEGINGSVELNKVYAFAFMRFVVRMAQRNWLRPKTQKKSERDITLVEHSFEDLSQTEFEYE